MAIDFIVTNPYLSLNAGVVLTFIFFLASWVLMKFNKSVVTRSIIMLVNIFFVIYIFNLIKTNGNLTVYNIYFRVYQFDDITGNLLSYNTYSLPNFTIDGNLAYIMVLLHIVLLSYAVISKTFDITKRILG